MSFASPQVLLLLLVFPPALILFFWWSWRRRQALIGQFIQARLLPGLLSGVSSLRHKVRLGCLVAAVACLIVALARPQWGFSWEEIKHRGLDIVVAIDTSKSMLAQDIAPNRLARAKLAALELMNLAKTDRLGLVAFAGDAFLQCPLTIDDAAFSQSVNALDVNTIPQGGTAVAAAIETALTAFKEGDNLKVLVLMTDGEDHDSGAVEAARKAAQAGLQIFTIGIGTAEGELLRVSDGKGGSDYIRDEQGNVVKSHLNETLLQEIAGATEKGFYLPLRGAGTIDTLFQKGLGPLPKSESNQTRVKKPFERFQWPLGLAIALLAVEMVWPERKREPKLPAPPSNPNGRKERRGLRQTRSQERSKELETTTARNSERQRAGEPGSEEKTRTDADRRSALQQTPDSSGRYRAVGVSLLLLAGASTAFCSPSSALREYKAGQYDEALKDYEQLLQRRGDDPRLRFNTGAAAYRSRQFDEAAKQFTESLNASRDLNLQSLAYYNRGNSLYWLGEQNPDSAKRSESWEKALKDFESSLKLNPQDADAKFNQEFDKRKLEELKQQQQQQQKNQQNKSDQQKNQDKQQQQQQQQQQSDQNKQDQSQQQQADQKQSEQKQDASQQQQQKQEDQRQQQAAQSQEQKDKQQEQQQQAGQAGQKGDKSDEQNMEEAAAKAGQMTPEQARQLLDAQKGDEQVLQLKPEGKPVDRSKPVRDW